MSPPPEKQSPEKQALRAKTVAEGELIGREQIRRLQVAEEVQVTPSYDLSRLIWRGSQLNTERSIPAITQVAPITQVETLNPQGLGMGWSVSRSTDQSAPYDVLVKSVPADADPIAFYFKGKPGVVTAWSSFEPRSTSSVAATVGLENERPVMKNLVLDDKQYGKVYVALQTNEIGQVNKVEAIVHGDTEYQQGLTPDLDPAKIAYKTNFSYKSPKPYEKTSDISEDDLFYIDAAREIQAFLGNFSASNNAIAYTRPTVGKPIDEECKTADCKRYD
jgi:hypothetical protein